MAKSRLKARRPDADVPKPSIEDPGNAAIISAKAEQQIRSIIEKGKKKGYLTYEEMGDQLPGEAATPARLDRLLATLDEMGITLVDEADPAP